MKKFIILFLSIFALSFGFSLGEKTYAKDIIPVRPNVVTVNTVGLYQVGNDIKIYKEPNEESQILYRVRWNNDEFFPETIGAEKFFTLFLTL